MAKSNIVHSPHPRTPARNRLSSVGGSAACWDQPPPGGGTSRGARPRAGPLVFGCRRAGRMPSRLPISPASIMASQPSRRLLLVSNSRLYGEGYLEHCEQQMRSFFGGKVNRVLFIPYALYDRDAYAKTAREKFETLGYGLDSIHESSDPVEAIRKSEAIFVGGGNTFRLLKTLYDLNLIPEIRERVLHAGVPYMGSSAGTNIATISINTTNDMPIVFPPSLEALGFVPFNINPHYLDPDVNSTHMGETREARILQYHEEPHTPPVLGLREGSILLVEGNKATLLGRSKARLFLRGQTPTEHEPGTDFSFLLNGS
ncbi:alpha-aspartyl dipeptidase-like isoform X2 [Monodelphis domestica]|uniref:dipeptidase E n=1 Tax=Monodelphis domestica TaxID=13616 RepID=A0A5F8G6J1_MONDO|nr:alpha-aspartyl dipeptidase-like isoform X2 [Monodelphis domestica]